MTAIPKIKEIRKIYEIKIKIRYTKYLIKNIIFLFLNRSDFKKIISYTKHFFKLYQTFFFKKLRIKINLNDFYKQKYFDHDDWFTHKIPIFIDYFDNINKNEIIEILEIGSWEGRSTCFFSKYFKNSIITCVDTWKGSPENFVDDKTDLNKVEKNFDKNVFEFKERIIKNKTQSNMFFDKNKKKFDLIFVDGSHHYDDVLNDAQKGFEALKMNSYMLFDDYDWNFHKYGKNPVNAINLFLKLNKERIKIIYISSQVLVKKIKL